MKYKTLLFLLLGLFTLSIAGIARGNVDGVLILRDGERIAAKIKDISPQLILFEAKNSKQAYEYGEEISTGEVIKIQTSNGEVLSVEHFRESFFPPEAASPSVSKRAPQRKRAEPRQAAKQPVERDRSDAVDDIAASLIDAGLAAAYLEYLQESDGRLTQAEGRLGQAIADNPAWAERLDDLEYIDGIAREAFARAFRYQPEELSNKLALQFEEDGNMNYRDLMQQLHDRMGSQISNTEFKALEDVFGKGSARAISDILQNYSSWKFLQTKSK